MYNQHDVRREKQFSIILDRLLAGLHVTKNQIELLLQAETEKERERLYSAARIARSSHFSNNIFLYGFIYFSTYCKNDCTFCLYRRSNTGITRYRKSPEEIIAAAKEIADSGVHLLDLTMGEDPIILEPESEKFQTLLHTIRKISTSTGLPIMISPGALGDEQLHELAAAGVDWYACYQETHNREHFQSLRYDQDYDHRLNRKQQAAKKGFLVEEGILLGTGEEVSDIADSLLWMKMNKIDQVRAMRFVPPPNYTGPTPSNTIDEEIVIAVMRLLMPDRLIPASLDVDGLDGLSKRLKAGANVITSIIPSQNGLAGVANQSLDIEENRRSPRHIQPILKNLGLQVADQKLYTTWLKNISLSHPIDDGKR